MAHEGMVHALEEIHRLLKPAGVLIEIHPSVDAPPFIEVRSGGRLLFSEPDPVFDYEEDLRQAEAAVASVVSAGVFALEDRRRFELRTYAASVKELRDHWTLVGAYDPEEPEETLAQRRDEMYGRAHEALERAPGSEIVFVEPAMMSRLAPGRGVGGGPAGSR
jgi:SAM-dependent methyltransferase